MIDEVWRTSDDARVAALLDDAEASLREGLLPLKVYNDDAVHRAELERIFARCWVFVGFESEIPHPGDFAARRNPAGQLGNF